MARGVADTYPASLTMTQAAISSNMTCIVGGTEYDPEDPMCAKLTIQGTMTKAALAPNSEGPDDMAIGKQALFARHPQMKMWPAGVCLCLYFCRGEFRDKEYHLLWSVVALLCVWMCADAGVFTNSKLKRYVDNLKDSCTRSSSQRIFKEHC